MWTISYRGFFVHGYCDRAQCSIQHPNGERLGSFKSLRAAQLYITARCDWTRVPQLG